MSSVAELSVSVTKPVTNEIKKIDSKALSPVNVLSTHAVFTPEADLDNQAYRYMVRLVESPVALYQGSILGFKATSVEHSNTNERKLNVNDSNVKAYRSYLSQRQNNVISQAKNLIGDDLDVKQQTTLAYNGMVIEMTQAQAMKLATVPGVAHIKRETLRYIQTDAGPEFIKVPGIWDGSANGSMSKGEGMIVGIIDTGINSDSPSFADVGGDGYDHTNPNGAGVYSGDCATDEWAALCNDKLIGIHSYPVITDNYPSFNDQVPANGEDYNGHGSHTAGTTAGNVLDNVDSGNGVTFDQISGVAPHANIISYQVCNPGAQDAIGFSGCYPSLTVLAVEHAIEAGVDAINYSIGGGSSDPWQDSDSLAFLSARKAGIHVATSAGNSGPEAGTVGSPGDSPWLTTVAAGTHNRDIVRNVTVDDTDYTFTLGSGPEITENISAPLVYAGTVDAVNFEGCGPFPADSFKDSMALISRGACAFADKVNNAAAAGATSVIVHNNRGGSETISMAGLEATLIPSVSVTQDTGAEIITQLAAMSGLTTTINPTPTLVDVAGGEVANFSSRGANASVADVIVPSITAPGVSIFAAYADEQPEGFKENPSPSEFAFLSGTSMASPHIAGSLTLLASIHPEWSPAEAQSALMLTANQATVLQGSDQAANFFDMGAGYANVSAAAKSGLVMDESYAGYMQADPNLGGVPSQINLASMANSKCVESCSWTRTVKATTDASWTATTMVMAEGLTVTVSPEMFELAAGETQELTITANTMEAAAGWNFANVVLTADELPQAQLPVAVQSNGDNLPDSITVTGNRSTGSITYTGFKSNDLVDIQAGIHDKASLLTAPITLNVPDDYLDYVGLTFDEMVPNITFKTSSATAPDVDLRILDGSFAPVASSAGPDSNEEISFVNFPAGTYYIVVDGYTGSAPGAIDQVMLEISSVIANEDSLSDTLSATITENESDFSITIDWNAELPVNGFLTLSSADESYATLLPIKFVRGANDVEHMVSDELLNGNPEMAPGVAQQVSFNIAPNFTNEDKDYMLMAKLPAGHDVANISHDGMLEGDMISWSITRAVGESAEVLPVSFDLIPRTSGTGYEVTLSDTLSGDTATSMYTFGVINVAPVAMVDAPATILEKTTLVLDGSVSTDQNGDELSFGWVQLSGSPASFDATAATISFVTPKVAKEGDTMSFQLYVTDSNGNTDMTFVSVALLDKKSKKAGTFAWLMLLITPMIWARRNKSFTK